MEIINHKRTKELEINHEEKYFRRNKKPPKFPTYLISQPRVVIAPQPPQSQGLHLNQLKAI